MDFSTHFVCVDDGSLPGNEEEQKQLFSEWTRFNMEEYYRYVHHITVPTSFVHVSNPELLLKCLSSSKLDQESQAFLDGLIVSLDAVMNGQECFVKLQRSPKDAIDKGELMIQSIEWLRIELAGLLNKQTNLCDDDVLIALKAAFGRALCASSGSHVLKNIFPLSNRIVSDLVRFRKLFGDTDHKLYIVVRKFVNIPLYSEFRCFVCRRKLTAATQYFTDLFFSNLQGREYELKQRLIEFVGTLVLPALPLDPAYDSCIVDVALLDDGTAQLIELNPFSVLTGTGLFDWKADHDLIQGKREFELRIVKQSRGLKLTTAWQKIVDQILAELGEDNEIAKQFEESNVEM